MIPVTVFGADGFIGRALVAHLRATGRPVNAITRRNLPMFLVAQPEAGDVIYCLGLTADFRSRPLDTAEAHVGLLARLLAAIQFRSFLYLSSTRVYARCETAREDVAIPVQPNSRSDLYNVTKLAGEALCLSATATRCAWRGCRMSSAPAWHRESFLGQILAEGAATGPVDAPPESALRQGLPRHHRGGAGSPQHRRTWRRAALQHRQRRQHDARRHRARPFRAHSAGTSWRGTTPPRPAFRASTSAASRWNSPPPATRILDDLPQLCAVVAPEVAC